LGWNKKSKTIPGIVFAILLAFLGLIIGTTIGSFFAPDGSGLAGPAIALGYGSIGLLIAIFAGILLVRKLNIAQLRYMICVCSKSWEEKSSEFTL
ncbi:MAG: hypothetical protein ACE5I1_32355, partial [bacterium]